MKNHLEEDVQNYGKKCDYREQMGEIKQYPNLIVQNITMDPMISQEILT